MLTKNCAHFFIAELAIWMAGGTTVAIFPTETADTVRYVLEHSEASLLFVGKLDTWPQQAPGVPAGLPCIALPLAPPTTFDDAGTPSSRAPRRWPAGRNARADDLAMLLYTSGSTGQPKGVMHSFGRITRAIEGMRRRPASDACADGVTWRTLSYLPLAHIYERACGRVPRRCVAGDGQVFFAESLDTFMRRPASARGRRSSSRCRACGSSSSRACSQRCRPSKLDALLADPGHGSGGRAQGARRPGPGRSAPRRQRLGADPARAAGLVPAPGPEPDRGLRDDRRLRLLAPHDQRRRAAAAMSASPCPGVQVRIADDGEVLIKSPGQMVGYYKRPDLNAEASPKTASSAPATWASCAPTAS